jgi:hypothetical protein
MIVPASVEFDGPGADDPTIQADIVATLGRHLGEPEAIRPTAGPAFRHHVDGPAGGTVSAE